MMNDTPFTRREEKRDQGAPAEAGRSDTIDGGEPTAGAAGSVVGAASATGCSESVDDATLSFLAGGRSASRRMTSSRQSSLTACFFSSSAPSGAPKTDSAALGDPGRPASPRARSASTLSADPERP